MNPVIAAIITPATAMIGNIVDSEYAAYKLLERVVMVAL
jgi:hypothetical protein